MTEQSERRPLSNLAITDKIPSRWDAKETTDPKHVAASLRYGTHARENRWENAAFSFPYHKLINGERYFWHLRYKRGYVPRYSLDIGTFGLEKVAGKDVFNSKAWLDFKVTSNSTGKRRYAEAYKSDQVLAMPPYVKRGFDYHSNYALVVRPEIQQQHVGTSLITAARVLLVDQGVASLHLTGISDLDKNHPVGMFYRSQGGHLYDCHIYTERYSPFAKHLTGKIALPTAQTSWLPLSFT